MTKAHNNHEKKEPDEAIKHIKRNLTANIQGILKRIEKEKQIGFLLDYLKLINEECLEAMIDLHLVTRNGKTKRPGKRT